jgi:hypothetical protein
MTRVTRNAVKPHDLRSSAIIERLRLTDHLLIDEIASVLYSKILQVIESDIPTIDDWRKRDEKLKWVLHTQVEILGHLSVCEEITNALVKAEEGRTYDLLKELMYGHHFLSQEISALFYDLDYSTWNLLDFLNPGHYYTQGRVSASLSQELLELLHGESSPQTPSLNKLWKRLSAKGAASGTIQLTKIQLAEWLLWRRRYELLIRYFYQTSNFNDALYAFNYSVSFAARLLGISLSLKLSIESLSNSVKGAPDTN